jgi:hypothetical protein
LLYQYLEKRFANTVVLTFTQIEDLLGFALPESAQVDQQWWANDDHDGERDGQSRSWTLASRTATANLQARTVAFERAQQHRRKDAALGAMNIRSVTTSRRSPSWNERRRTTDGPSIG